MILSAVLPGCGKKEVEISETITNSSQNETSVQTEVVDEKKKEEADKASKAEEESRQAEEKEKAEEQARAEEESRQAEEKKKAEEQARVEEERRKAEEERLKKEAEDKKAEEERQKAAEEARKKEQNSFSMMYYMAIMAEDIRIAKNNRLDLEDLYTSSLNDINPNFIDERTQDHFNNLRAVIKSYLNISTKRDRLMYIYNQNKAAAMRSAVPNPLAVLSMANSLDWKRLAISAVYTVADSYRNYKNASEASDNEYLMSGWELDDEELKTIQKNRETAFNYMVDMVQEYHLDGLKALSEKDIQNFSEICAIEYSAEKIKRLKAEEKKYELLGNYWFELANCYFEDSRHGECLACVDKYIELTTDLYKKDKKKAQLLVKAIVAAQDVYSDGKYVSVIDDYAQQIVNNTMPEDWASRYFVAQAYIDLYAKTKEKPYLEEAYKLISENVTVLLKGQREINATYLDEVREEVAVDPKTTKDYKYLSKEQQKQKDKQYSEEKKRVKEFNKALKETRKTELLSVYEPLILNCELLFALADEIKISQDEKREMDDILRNNVFLVDPIRNAYSFNRTNEVYSAELSKDEIIIPANLLTAEAVIEVSVTDNGISTKLDDCKVTSVKREGKTIDTFKAYISGKQWKKYSWTANSRILIRIIYKDVYDKELVLRYKVGEYKDNWFGDKVVFVKE